MEQEATFIRLALKQTESGGRYNIVSKDQGQGAYQFTGTWPAWSREYTAARGEEPTVLPMTPENQDAVAQFKIEQMLARGYSPDQVAALWNTGSHPDWAGRVGVNKWGVRYDVPYHVEKFRREYSKATGEPMPERFVSRERVSDVLRSVLPPDQYEPTMGFLDTLARSWSDKYEGATESDFWAEKLGGFRADPHELRLVQDAVKGLVPERLFLEADDPRALYQSEGKTSNPEEFLKSPSGAMEWGEIDKDLAGKIGRQSGPIKLQFGTDEGESRHGWVHVKERHEREIRAAGYSNVDQFIHDVSQNYTQVRQGKGRSLFLVKAQGQPRVAIVEMAPDASGDFYRVKTAYLTTTKGLKKRDLLWERQGDTSVQVSSGETPPYYQSTVEAGGDRRSPNWGHNIAERISPDSEIGKNHTQIKGAVHFLEDGRAVITLFRGADLSTIIHEFGGHLGRRLLDGTDTAILENWLGVKDGQWSQAHEERFAKAFERYVLEGDAPSLTLRNIFGKLKTWLLDIYQQADNVFPDEIPDDVRAVFDRMVSTEAERRANMVNRLADEYGHASGEIVRSKAEGAGEASPSGAPGKGRDFSETTHEGAIHSLPVVGTEGERVPPSGREGKPLFQEAAREPSAEPSRKGLSPDEEYRQIQAEAYRRAWEEVKKEDVRSKKKTESMLRKQAADAYENEQIYHDVKDVIKAGGISLDSLRDYSSDFRQRLMRRWPRLLRKDSRYGLDEFAADYGYENIDEVVDILRNAPTKAEYVENFVAEGMKDYGGEAGLSAEEWLARLLKHEIGIMKELTRESTAAWENVPRKGFKQVVNELTGVTRVRETQMITEHDALKAGLQKAARAAREAWRAGDKAGALREKLKQEGILEMYKAKVDARQEAANIKKQLISFLGVKNLTPEYRDALVDLMHYVAPKLGADISRRVNAYKSGGYTLDDFLTASNESYARAMDQKDKGQPLADLLAGLQERGEFFPVEPQELYALLAKPFREFTVDDLRSVRDVARMVVKMSRIQDRLLSAQKKVSFDRTMNDLLVHGMQTAYGRGMTAASTPAERLQQIAARDYEQSGITKFLYSMTIPEYLVRDLDGWRDFGEFHNNIIRPIMQARSRESVLVEQLSERIKAAESEFEKAQGVRFDRWLNQKFDVPGMVRPLRREQILFTWANAQNPANLRTLRPIY